MNKAEKVVRRLRFGPRVRTSGNHNLVHLGSQYGGWTIVDNEELHGSTILSCGLGEDASFDVEFANRYQANVVIIDPTPRAVAHFEMIQSCLGSPKKISYQSGGCQPIESYDLKNLVSGQLKLVPKALTGESGVVKFYEPPNPRDVSYSVINFQNNYSDATPYIEVESIDPADLLSILDDKAVPLLKLDIEGAENEVLPMVLKTEMAPRQIIVEFDELNHPSRRSRTKFDASHSLLLASGYSTIYFDGRSCFTYYKE